MNIFAEFWQRQRERTLRWMEDLYGYVLTLVGLFAVYGLFELGRKIGYDDGKIDVLENIDFAGAVAVFLAGLYRLFGTLIAGDKLEEKPRKSAGAPNKKNT
jgi:hypothetical protein